MFIMQPPFFEQWIKCIHKLVNIVKSSDRGKAFAPEQQETTMAKLPGHGEKQLSPCNHAMHQAMP